MLKVFTVSIAGLFVMLSVATYAACQSKSSREPASAEQGIPKNLYHSAKY
jgi:hypothetical protein